MTDIATTTARDRAERIRAKTADLLREITEAFENQDHITLGYRTWGEYCRAEFDGRIALPRVKGDRVELCAALVDAGLSQRAVAEATGLSRNTVSKYVAPPAQIEPPAKFTIPTTIEAGRELNDKIRAIDAQLYEKLIQLYEGRAWETLGYATWDEMVQDKWPKLNFTIPSEKRRSSVEPMSSRRAQTEFRQRDHLLAAERKVGKNRAAKIRAEVERIHAEYSDDEFALIGDLLDLELEHRAETERFLAERRGEL